MRQTGILYEAMIDNIHTHIHRSTIVGMLYGIPKKNVNNTAIVLLQTVFFSCNKLIIILMTKRKCPVNK